MRSPQGLSLGESAGESGASMLRMKVRVAEYLGTETVINGTLAASDELVTASVTGEHGGIAGREIGLLVDPVHLHVFDAASGLNLIH